MTSMQLAPVACFVALLASAACIPEGRKKRDSQKIVGGTEVAAHSWPFLVQISNGNPNEIWCGGAIVNENYILTAAHCFKGFESSLPNFRVTAGQHDLTVPEDAEQMREIEQAILHPQYDSSNEKNDVALLKLKTPLNLSGDKVKAIDLNTASASVCPPVDKLCSVAGWGRLESGGATPNKPQSVQVTVISNAACSAPDVYGNKIFESSLCAGEKEGGKDSCQGDSGGPFVCKCPGSDERVHVGIVSWGEGCAAAGKPGVYARTSSFNTWITETMGGSGGGGGGSGGTGGGSGGTGGGSGGTGGGDNGGGDNGGGSNEPTASTMV